jgi:hypothetical protein
MRACRAKIARMPLDAPFAAWQHPPHQFSPRVRAISMTTAIFNRLPIQAPCALGSRMARDAEGVTAQDRPLSGRPNA